MHVLGIVETGLQIPNHEELACVPVRLQYGHKCDNDQYRICQKSKEIRVWVNFHSLLFHPVIIFLQVLSHTREFFMKVLLIDFLNLLQFLMNMRLLVDFMACD